MNKINLHTQAHTPTTPVNKNGEKSPWNTGKNIAEQEKLIISEIR